MTVLERLNSGALDRLGVDDFARLAEVGAFNELGRVELIDGEIVSLSPQARPHLRVKTSLFVALREALLTAHPELTVFSEGTIALSAHDAPDPDVFVTDQPDGAGFVPGSSIRLIVEVADTSLRIDLGRKALLYAQANIPEYWVADVAGATVHRLCEPRQEGYARRDTFAFGQPVSSISLPGVSVIVTD